MKTPIVLFTVILEIAFVVYLIHMTYLLDVLDPLPKEMMVPNVLIGAVILGFGLIMATWMNRSLTTHSERE